MQWWKFANSVFLSVDHIGKFQERNSYRLENHNINYLLLQMILEIYYLDNWYYTKGLCIINLYLFSICIYWFWFQDVEELDDESQKLQLENSALIRAVSQLSTRVWRIPIKHSSYCTLLKIESTRFSPTYQSALSWIYRDPAKKLHSGMHRNNFPALTKYCSLKLNFHQILYLFSAFEILFTANSLFFFIVYI